MMIEIVKVSFRAVLLLLVVVFQFLGFLPVLVMGHHGTHSISSSSIHHGDSNSDGGGSSLLHFNNANDEHTFRHQQHYSHRLEQAVNDFKNSQQLNHWNSTNTTTPTTATTGQSQVNLRHHRSNTIFVGGDGGETSINGGTITAIDTEPSPFSSNNNNNNNNRKQHHLRHHNRHHQAWEQRVFPSLHLVQQQSTTTTERSPPPMMIATATTTTRRTGSPTRALPALIPSSLSSRSQYHQHHRHHQQQQQQQKQILKTGVGLLGDDDVDDEVADDDDIVNGGDRGSRGGGYLNRTSTHLQSRYFDRDGLYSMSRMKNSINNNNNNNDLEEGRGGGSNIPSYNSHNIRAGLLKSKSSAAINVHRVERGKSSGHHQSNNVARGLVGGAKGLYDVSSINRGTLGRGDGSIDKPTYAHNWKFDSSSVSSILKRSKSKKSPKKYPGLDSIDGSLEDLDEYYNDDEGWSNDNNDDSDNDDEDDEDDENDEGDDDDDDEDDNDSDDEEGDYSDDDDEEEEDDNDHHSRRRVDRGNGDDSGDMLDTVYYDTRNKIDVVDKSLPKRRISNVDIEDIYSRSYIPGTLTQHKFEMLGTHEAVKQSRKSHITNQKQHRVLANAHASKIYSEARCRTPKSRVEKIQKDPSKVYVPHCTILHRCGDDTGCCSTDTQTCVPKHTQNVDLYFFVKSIKSKQGAIERHTFINHTECHCVERSSHHSSHLGPAAMIRKATILDCNCPRLFEKVLQEDGVCRCDCSSGNSGCDWLKRGMEHFSMVDRKCIMEGRCKLPTCEYGSYVKKQGRCPRKDDKLSSYSLLSFH